MIMPINGKLATIVIELYVNASQVHVYIYIYIYIYIHVHVCVCHCIAVYAYRCQLTTVTRHNNFMLPRHLGYINPEL